MPGDDEQLRENFEQLVTEILVALDDFTDLPDGPSVDDAREAVMRELLCFGSFHAERDAWKAQAERAEAALERIANRPITWGTDTLARIARDALAAVQPDDRKTESFAQPEAPCPTCRDTGRIWHGHNPYKVPCPDCTTPEATP